MGKIDSIFDSESRFIYDTFYKGAKPFVIVRDQAERLWSGYHYLGYDNTMKFEDFLYVKDETRQNLGFNRPMEMCNWTPYLKPFADLDPVIVRLDAILKEEEKFPHVKDQESTNPKYNRDMPQKYRNLVYSKLDEMKLDKYGVPMP